MVSSLRMVRNKGDEMFRVPFPIGREKTKKATQTILKEGPTKMSIANSAKSQGQFQWMSVRVRIMGNFFFLFGIPFDYGYLPISFEHFHSPIVC